MKIIHCADIHLGSAMDSKLPADKAEERRKELRATFSRLISYARDNSVGVIILAGDVFDVDRPLKRDKQFFYEAVRANPQIDFLYLRGNHDREESYTEYDLKNLKTFTGGWTRYSYVDADIYGVELPEAAPDVLLDCLLCPPDRYNIVTLHGQIGGEINLAKIRGKNVDYLALGHIHSHTEGVLDGRGTYAYSGCLEGRGFDETGEKGFILLDTTARSAQFVPFARRTVDCYKVDVSAAANAYGAYTIVKDAVPVKSENLLCVELCGQISFCDEKLAAEVESYLSPACYFAYVKDKTVKKLDLAAISAEPTLRGEFVRTVLADGNIPPEDKDSVISIGLAALERGEVEL